MAPINMMRQNTIYKIGRIVDKDRLTHDQSFIWGSGTSINKRVDNDDLLPCMLSYAIKRIIN
eukprot:10330605-Ditylum_brightwellii.AAC.1